MVLSEASILLTLCCQAELRGTPGIQVVPLVTRLCHFVRLDNGGLGGNTGTLATVAGLGALLLLRAHGSLIHGLERVVSWHASVVQVCLLIAGVARFTHAALSVIKRLGHFLIQSLLFFLICQFLS